MSEIANTVSGRTYVFDHNSLGFRRFRLTFDPELVLFEFSFRDTNVEVEVGMDGEFCMADTGGFVRAYKGRWSEDDTFAMTYEIMGTPENGGIEITFQGDAATVLFFEHATEMREVMHCSWDRGTSDAP